MANHEASTHLSVRALYLVLTVLFWLVAIAISLGVPAGIASSTTTAPYALPATVPAGSLSDLPWDSRFTDRIAVTLQASDLSTTQIAVFHGAIAVGGLLLLFTLHKMRQIVRSVRDGDPFISANAQRLRVLGIVVILWSSIAHYVSAGINEWIITTRGPDIPSVAADAGPFPWSALIGGLCLLVLAEVFAHGIRLREDVEATI